MRRIFIVLKKMLFDFAKTTSPDFERSMPAIISGVMSPV